MDNLEKRFSELIEKQNLGSLSDNESAELDRLTDDLGTISQLDENKAWLAVETRFKRSRMRRYIRQIAWRAAIIAIPLIVVSVSLFLSREKTNDELVELPTEKTQNTRLVSAEGDVVSFKELKNGALSNLQVEGNEITITDDQPDLNIQNDRMHELIVARGEEYKVILPCGSSVWLNADSKLKFPSSFNGSVREVWLDGEATFDVASAQRKPFIVHTNRLNIRVMGTLFNVSSYATDQQVKVALLRGSVEVDTDRDTKMLNPSEIAILDNQSEEITLRKIDTKRYEKELAGMIYFDDESLEEIARRIERRYDIEVVFANDATKKRRYYGEISKRESFKNVFVMLSQTRSFEYKVEGRRVTIF